MNNTPTPGHRFVQILQQNCARRSTVLQTVLNDPEAAKADILCIQEPSTNRSSNLPPSHHAYYLFAPTVNLHDHRPRSCIYVNKSTVPAAAIKPLPSPSPDVTAIALLQPDAPDLILINAYVDPTHHRALEHIEALVTLSYQARAHVVLMGDFNLHDPLWNPPEYLVTDDKAADLIDICSTHDLVIVSQCGTPTRIATQLGHSDTTIDLVWTSLEAADAVVECRTLPRTDLDFLSDHLAIVTTIDLALPPPSTSQPYLWDSANWELAITTATTLFADWSPPLDTAHDVDAAFAEMVELTVQVCETAVPRARTSEHSKRWWSEGLSPLRRQASRKRREWQRYRNPRARTEWLAASNKYRDACLLQKRLHWQRFLSETTPTTLYRTVRVARNGRDPVLNVPPIRKPDGSYATSPPELAAEFHRAFTTTTPVYDNDDIASATYPPEPPWLFIPEVAFDNAVKALPPDKAPGFDGVKGALIKRIWDKALRGPYIRCCQASWRLGHYPSIFKRTISAILRKPGRETYQEAKSYRPIALLPTLARPFDRVLSDLLSSHLEHTNHLPRTSFGGRSGRSTTDAMTVLTEDIHSAWADKQCVALLSVDAEAAFPSFRNDRVIDLLRKAGTPRPLTTIIGSYLHERYTAYRANGVISKYLLLLFGLPQGSSLAGPISNLYMAPLVRAVRTVPRLKEISFADDLTAYTRANTVREARLQLQEVSDVLLHTGATLGIRFSPLKSKYIYFTRNRLRDDPTPLLFGGTALLPESSIRILGVTFDTNLNFKAHIQKAVKRGKTAVMALGSLANTKGGLPFPLWRRLYLTCVVPSTDYGAVVWHRLTKPSAATRSLQLVQNLAMRIMLGAFRTTSIPAMQYDSNLDAPLDRLNRMCANAVVRILHLPRSNPVTDCVRLAQTSPRRLFRSPLDLIVSNPSLALPPITGVSPIPLVLNSLSWRPRHTTVIPATEEDTILNLERVLENSDPKSVVFTDGSSIDGGVGCAAVFGPFPNPPGDADENVIHVHLGSSDDHTNYTAELLAIKTAIRFAPMLPTIHLFTDSQSALRALESSPHRCPDLSIILEIHRLIELRHGTVFHLHWIKAHADVHGNDRADHHAKLAAQIPECSDERIEPPPPSASSLKRKTASLLPAPVPLEGGGAHRAIRDDVPAPTIQRSLARLPRGICSVVVQLRSGHAPLRQYLHWRNHRATDRCLKCRAPESIHHYLMTCSRFTFHRQRLRAALSDSKVPFRMSAILSNPRATPHLADFISSTKRFPNASPPPLRPFATDGQGALTLTVLVPRQTLAPNTASSRLRSMSPTPSPSPSMRSNAGVWQY